MKEWREGYDDKQVKNKAAVSPWGACLFFPLWLGDV